MDKEKFKSLSFKKKIEWLIQYYGLAAIAVLVTIGVIISLVKAIFFPAPPADICVLIYSDEVNDQFVVELEEIIEADTGKNIEVTKISPSSAYGNQALSARLTDENLDLVLAPITETDYMKESDFLTESTPIDGTEMYMDTTIRARDGELLSRVREILLLELTREIE